MTAKFGRQVEVTDLVYSVFFVGIKSLAVAIGFLWFFCHYSLWHNNTIHRLNFWIILASNCFIFDLFYFIFHICFHDFRNDFSVGFETILCIIGVVCVLLFEILFCWLLSELYMFVSVQDAKKGVLFIDFPPVLQLQLKRFEYDFTRDTMVKVRRKYWETFPIFLVCL